MINSTKEQIIEVLVSHGKRLAEENDLSLRLI